MDDSIPMSTWATQIGLGVFKKIKSRVHEVERGQGGSGGASGRSGVEIQSTYIVFIYKILKGLIKILYKRAKAHIPG